MTRSIVRIIEEVGRRYGFKEEEIKAKVFEYTTQSGINWNGNYEEKMKEMRNYEKIICTVMDEIGIPDIKGYKYLQKAIMLTLTNAKILGYETKSLYPIIARVFETTVKKVERSMSYAIETAWDKGNTEKIYQIFEREPYEETGIPSNSEFIATISDYIAKS